MKLSPLAKGALILGGAAAAAIVFGAASSASAASSQSVPVAGKVVSGVWIRQAALSKPATVAKLLATTGVKIANVMINDFAAKRSPTQFAHHDRARLVALSKAMRDAGLLVDVTTWVMPHETFIDGMADALPALLEQMGVRRVWLDAEEPWTKAKSPLPWLDAAQLVAEAIPAEYPITLSAISYANADALRPLSRVCDYWSPQAYATTREGSSNPATIVGASVDRWRERFAGSPRRGWVMGLAAYSQPSNAASMMAPPVAQAIELDIPEVCYWSHTSLEATPAVRNFIKSVSSP